MSAICLHLTYRYTSIGISHVPKIVYYDKMPQIKISYPQLKKYLYISAKTKRWRSPRIIPHIIKPGKITATLQGSPQPNKSTSLREWTQISLEIWNSLRNTTLVKVKLLRKLLHKWFTTGNKSLKNLLLVLCLFPLSVETLNIIQKSINKTRRVKEYTFRSLMYFAWNSPSKQSSRFGPDRVECSKLSYTT